MGKLSREIEAGRAYISIRLDKANLINGLEDVGKRMRTFGASVQSFGSDVMRLSLLGAVPLAAAVNSFIKFDDQMRITAAISGATARQLKGLTAQARYLGSTTAFTAQQIAVGQTALARLGNTAAQIAKATPNIMYATRATGNEMSALGEIAEIVGSVMNQYQKKIDEVQHTTDLLAFAANRSAQTIQDIGQAMRSVGGLANQLQDSMEDTLASMMLLANRGIRGELLGTALRKAYDGILTSADYIEKELGVSIRNSMGQLRKPYMIIADIFNVLSKKTNVEQMVIAKQIFGLRGMLAGLSLGVSQQEVFKIRDQLNRVFGYAKKTSDQMESGIGGAFRKMFSRAQDLLIEIGTVAESPLTGFMQSITSLLYRVEDFITKNKGLVNTFIMISTTGALAGASIMALGLAIKVVSVPFRVLSSILAALKVTAIVSFNAILFSAMALSKCAILLSLSFMSLAKVMTVFARGAIFGVANGMVAIAKGLRTATRAVSTGITAFVFLLKMLRYLPAVLSTSTTAVVPFIKAYSGGFVLVTKSVKDMATAFRWASNVFSFFVSSAMKIKSLKSGLVGLVSATKTAFSGGLSTMKSAFSGFMSTLKTSMKTAFSGLGKSIAVGMSHILGFGLAVAAIGATAYAAYKLFGDKLAGYAQVVGGKLKSVWEENKAAVIDFGKQIYTSFQQGDMEGAFRLALAGVMKVFYNFASKVVGMFADVRLAVLSIWDNIMDRMSGAFSKFGFTIRRIWNKYISSMWESKVETMYNLRKIDKEEKALEAERQKNRDNLFDKRMSQYQGTKAWAQSLQGRGDAEYEARMERARNYPILQQYAQNLRDAFQNASSQYRDKVLIDNAQKFYGSNLDRWASRGTIDKQKTKLQQIVKTYENASKTLEKDFERKLHLSMEDGKITDKENNALQKLVNLRGQYIYISEEARGKLQQLSENTGSMIPTAETPEEGRQRHHGVVSAAFDASYAKFGIGINSIPEKTLKATESLDKNVKWLRDYIAPIVGTVIA